MTITATRVTCAKCGWVGDVDLVTNAPIPVAVASMKAARCGSCGSDKIGFGGSYNDAPPLDAPIVSRASWWRRRGETGLSSLTIFGETDGNWGPSIPLDPADFRRCKLLLDLIPEWRATLNGVAERHPFWQPMVDAWAEFEALWAEESSKKTCHKLYARMVEVRKVTEGMPKYREAAIRRATEGTDA